MKTIKKICYIFCTFLLINNLQAGVKIPPKDFLLKLHESNVAERLNDHYWLAKNISISEESCDFAIKSKDIEGYFITNSFDDLSEQKLLPVSQTSIIKRGKYTIFAYSKKTLKDIRFFAKRSKSAKQSENYNPEIETELVVHEWGTFSFVQTADGKTTPGLSEVRTDLPTWVYLLGNSSANENN